MARIKKHIAGKDGWSEWVSPQMNQNYRLACCDCGLVHDLRFKVKRLTGRRGKDWWGETAIGMKVLFKARRNNRSTAQVRRADAKGKS